MFAILVYYEIVISWELQYYNHQQRKVSNKIFKNESLFQI